jgi:hypothetical protein
VLYNLNPDINESEVNTVAIGKIKLNDTFLLSDNTCYIGKIAGAH